MKDAFGGKKKNKPNESETKAVSSKCSSLSKAKLQRVIVGAAFVQLIILRFREGHKSF